MLLGGGVPSSVRQLGSRFEMGKPRDERRVEKLCIPGASSSTGFPAKDSVVVTRTPLGVSLKSHSCTL
jgi:hypothetical protein